MLRLALLCVLVSSATAAPCKERPLGKPTTRVSQGRIGLFARIVLRDGRELVAGGSAYGGGPSTEAKLAGKRVAPMAHARGLAVAVELADARVLVVGGSETITGDSTFTFAEIYDLQADRWTDAAPMVTGRVGHSATLMADGRVLVTGGKIGPYLGRRFATTAEIFDPAAGTWSAASPLLAPRTNHAAVGLADGRVLVVGGYDANNIAKTAELYDPACDKWTSMTAGNQLYSSPSLALLADGRALALTYSAYPTEVKSGTELRGSILGDMFDPAKGTWAAIVAAEDAGESDIRIQLVDNKLERCAGVIIGFSQSRPVQCHVYDPATNRWRKK